MFGKNITPNWQTDGSVECAIWEWKGSRIGGPEVHLFAGLKLCARHLKHWRVKISRRQMSSCMQKTPQLAGDDSSTCSRLQHACRTPIRRSPRNVHRVIGENHRSQATVVVLGDSADEVRCVVAHDERPVLGRYRTKVDHNGTASGH